MTGLLMYVLVNNKVNTLVGPGTIYMVVILASLEMRSYTLAYPGIPFEQFANTLRHPKGNIYIYFLYLTCCFMQMMNLGKL